MGEKLDNTILTLDEFKKVNKVELNCIFTESGADREICFDYDMEVEFLWNDREKYKSKYNLFYQKVET